MPLRRCAMEDSRLADAIRYLVAVCITGHDGEGRRDWSGHKTHSLTLGSRYRSHGVGRCLLPLSLGSERGQVKLKMSVV
jgi:hypothetical protein